LLRGKLEESFTRDVPSAVEQVQFRYILFETLEGAQTAEAQLKTGSSYDELYARVQAGEIISASGSLQSWMPLDDIAASFGSAVSDALAALAISQTSQIITDTFGYGYFILQQEGREVRPLTEYQIDDRRQKAFQNWLNSQRNGPGVNLFNYRFVDYLPPTPSPRRSR